MTNPSLPLDDYTALRAEAETLGLFKRTPIRYLSSIGAGVVGMIASLYIVTVTDSALVQFLNALLFVFSSIRVGTGSHDLSHDMVFSSPALNRNVGTVTWALFVGMSGEKWFINHNLHHKHVNHVGYDPDITIPFVFSEKQFPDRPPPAFRWLFKFQHITFWVALPFVYMSYVARDIAFVLMQPTQRNILELILIVLHFSILFFFAFYFLPLLVALLYLAIVLLTGGMYLGVIFAPNHKGMDEIGSNEPEWWTQQITSTRNITPNPAVFFLYGGLNYQIEHHLFTTMSRFKLSRARVLVKKFCNDKGISYYEVPWRETFRELYTALKREAKKSFVA